ncbi:MAG: hypothetical protein PHG69_02210, partial [Candidatus Omnitrophica bacterium]|nr:hypothetical protein [Candidatus Omnitrophota bacterium]
MLAGVLSTFNHDNNADIALANGTAQFGVGAVAPQFLEINAILRTVEFNGTGYDINWASTPTSLNFGTLVPVVNNVTGEFYYMTGSNAYAVVMYPVTSGRAYKIVQTGSDLSDGAGHTIVPGAYVMTPDYQYADTLGGVAQGAMPAGASLAAPQSAVDTGIGNDVYTSNTAGTSKAIRAFMAITGPDADGNIRNYSQGHNGATGVGTAQYYQQGTVGDWDPVTQDQYPASYSGSVTFTLNLI